MAVNNSSFNLTIKVNGKEVKNTLNGVGKELRSMRARTKNLTEGTEEWVKANKELAKTEKIYDDMKKNQRELLNETKKNIAASEDQNAVLNEFGENMSQAFAALRAGDLVGFRTAMYGIAGGIKAAAKAGIAFIATPLGATLAGLAAIGLVTKSWFDYNVEISKTIKLTQQLTDFDGDRLSKYRASVQATAETFDKDFNEVLRSANALSKQMGITQEESLELINQGFIRGADSQGDFLSKLEEYPVQFKNAGYSAQDFIDIATQEAKGGVYDDKLVDALKEADLALKEMTQTQQDALENAFGEKFANEIATGLKSGEISTKQAIENIISKSEEMGLNFQQKQQLVADVFKGAGEDVGGFTEIIYQLNEAFDEQNKELSESEKATERLTKANTDYEQALADLFDASQSGFPAMLTNLEAIGSEIMGNILVGLKEMFTSIEQLKEQAGLEGQSNAVKEMVANAKEFGTTVAEEAENQMKATEKNIERLSKKVKEKKDSLFGNSEPYEKELAEQQAYFNELKAIAEGESKELQKYLDEIKSGDVDTNTNNGNGTGGGGDANKKVLAEEKKRLEAIAALEEEYLRKKEDRLADSKSKQLELDMQRAIDEAEALRAGEELKKQIREEYQVLIDEAKAEEEEKELERLAAFEERKQALLDELELQKAETDQEKEEIKKEQELEKEEEEYEKKIEDFQKEMERLQLNEEEKNAVLQALKESHEATLAGIQKKYTDKKIEDEQRLNQERKKLWNDSLNAAINAAGSETKVGQALVLAKQIMAAKEMAIQLGLFQAKMGLNAAEATGDIAKGAAKTASSAPFPANIPLIIGFGAQVAAIIGTIKQATSAGKSARKGFARGGFTDMFGTGVIDSTGHEVAGDVHVGEYVVPKIVREDPEVPQILNYLETKRKRKLGLYADGGDTTSTNSALSESFTSNNNEMLMQMMQAFMQKLDEPLEAPIYFGAEAELKRQEQQKKLDKIKQNSQIKKTV